tara:strand:- start:2802 stop:3101 length:300 start_codon:yes stop_codon:yes gene_type:complete
MDEKSGISDESYNELIAIKEKIESMPEQYHKDFLKIFHDNDENFNENAYGIHIIMNPIKKNTLKKLKEKIKYIEIQINDLKKIEKIKENLQSSYFSHEQ